MKDLTTKSEVSESSAQAGAKLTVTTRWLLAVILVVAAYLRLSHMDLFVWGGDGGNAATMAVNLVEGREFPKRGLMSSVGVYQAPLEIYVLTPFFAVTRDPLFFARCWAGINVGAVLLLFWVGKKFFSEKVGLVAAGFFAVSPWSVQFSRHVWAQGLVPVLTTLLLWVWCQFLASGKAKHLFGIVLLSFAVPQFHLAASAMVVVLLAMWMIFRFPLHRKAIGGGMVISGLFILPYLGYQLDHNWEDFQRAVAVMKNFNQSLVFTVQGIHPQFGFPFPTLDHLGLLLNLATGNQIEEFLGLSTADFHTGPGMWLWHPLIKLGVPVLWLCMVGLGIFLIRKAKSQSRFPFFDISAESKLTLLFLWLMLPVIFFHVISLRCYLTYFSFIMPVPFLLLGWGIEQSERFFKLRCSGSVRRLAVCGLWSAVVAMLVGQLAYGEAFYDYFDRHDGARGTCGVPYKHQLAMCEYIAQTTPIANPIVCEDWPPKTPVNQGLQYLISWQLKGRVLPSASLFSPQQKAYVVIDMRFQSPSDLKEPLSRLSFRTFGSWRLYEIPLSGVRP